MPNPMGNLTLENAQFIFTPNFEGRPSKYKPKGGDPEFNVIIPAELVPHLERDGWNLKWTKAGPNHPNPEEHVPEPYLNVSVNIEGYRPAQIILIRDGVETAITERTISLVDSTEFETMDVILRPYQWRMDDGSSGVKAYLKKFVGVVEMDDLDRKYGLGQGATAAPTVDEYVPDEGPSESGF